MKYAVINKFKGINRVSATEPTWVAEEATVVEISDELAAQVEAGRTAKPPVIYFLIDGALKTLQEKQEIDKLNRVYPELPAWRVRAIAKMTPIGNSNLHQTILSIIDAIPDVQIKTVANEAYLGGNTIARQSPLVLQVAQQLGLTSGDIDQIFIQAARLPS